ncbi:MAG: hypothetical protein ACREQN_00895, partial [Candidatus Binataceae bacterium]
GQRLWQVGVDKDDRYRFFETIEPGKGAATRVGDALFASMDLAPLFGEGRIGKKYYEDGGVLDPIPIRFGSPVEECDLLFVLPLAASVQPSRRRRSMLARTMRLLRISQGQLEHDVLKTADTLNRMVARVERLEFGVNTMAPSIGVEGLAAEALSGVREELAEFNRDYQMLYVFSICPSGKIDVDTFDFWNRAAVRDAFDLMYMHTKRELDSRLFEDVEPEDQHVVLVNGSVPERGKVPKPLHRSPSEL